MQPAEPPRLLTNLFADAVGPSTGGPDRDRCDCVESPSGGRPKSVRFHADRQDTTAAGWLHLRQLIDEAAADGRTVFKPFVELSSAERRQIITLPPSIANLTEVKRLVLYGTNLVRIPPEIGAMTSLEVFEPYTSHRLHWYPFELTRCARLADSTVSTRVLYGNFKLRPPFPALRQAVSAGEVDFTALDPGVFGTDAVQACSVCDQPLTVALHQVWLSLRLGTDVLPLLVNACSAACIAELPAPAEGYVATAHRGGPDVVQPASRW